MKINVHTHMAIVSDNDLICYKKILNREQ
jgi:hypothetical protein